MLTKLWLQLSMLVLLGGMTSQPINAQIIYTTQLPRNNPNPSQQIPPPQDVQPPAPSPVPAPQPPQPLPPPAELFPPNTPIPLPQESLPNNVPRTIIVERFEVVGSTVFSQQELSQATAEFTKRPISLAEVFQARSKITDLYVQKGYITSGAYIPEQKIKSGVIKIQVVEGKLEDIKVSGTGRLNPNYIRSRIAIATSPPLNQQRLLEALQILQLNPLIQNLSAELSAGPRFGTNVLEVKIKEAQTFSSQVVLDNGRSPSVGSFRRRVQLNEANLLGLGDGLSLGYTNTDGSNSFDASYTLPVNARNGTFSFNYGTSSSNVIERPFNKLDIASASSYYELTFRQPVFQTPRQEFVLGLTVSRRESEISSLLFQEEFGLLPNELSPGADREGGTRVSALRFFQEWTSRNSRQVIALRSQFNFGIGAFNATVNQNAPDSRFFSWQGQAQWVRLLAPETLLLLRLNTQLASRPLLPLEQFSIGGIDSIRGYRQDLLLADNGTFVSAEVQVPILSLPQTDTKLHIIPFTDFGVVWNSSSGNGLDPNTLASVGLGLRWTQGDRFTARLDWGIPLISVDSTQRTWQENGLYFSLQYNPF